MDKSQLNQRIDQLRLARDVLAATLEAFDSGRLKADKLPATTPVRIQPPALLPSDDVAAAVARSRRARDKLRQETDAKRAAAIALEIGAAVGRILIPLAGLLCLVLACLGCSEAQVPVQVGSASGPAATVQVGTPGQPVAAVHVGPTSMPAIRLDAPVHVAAPVDAALLRQSASHPSATDADQSAGRDARQTTVHVSASGSAWPLVAVATLAVCVVLLVAWGRAAVNEGDARRRELAAAHNTDRAAQENGILRSNARAVARAIRDLGPGPQRDRLLGGIKAGLHDRDAWDQVVADLRVRRDVKSHPARAAATT